MKKMENLTSLNAAFSEYSFSEIEDVYSEGVVYKNDTFLNIYRSKKAITKTEENSFFVSCIYNILEDIGEEEIFKKLSEKYRLIDDFQCLYTEAVIKFYKKAHPSLQEEIFDRLKNSAIINAIEYDGIGFVLLNYHDNYGVIATNTDLLFSTILE